MSDLTIYTYRSENAPERRRWVAYVIDPDSGNFWPRHWIGETEDQARANALADAMQALAARQKKAEAARQRAIAKAEAVS